MDDRSSPVLERARGERGGRLRAAAVVVVAVALVGAGAYARLGSDQPQRQRAAVPAVDAERTPGSSVPVVALPPVVPGVPPMDPPIGPPELLPHVGARRAPMPMQGLGDDGLIGGVPGGQPPIADAAVLVAVLRLDDRELHVPLVRDALGVLQGAVTLREPRRTVDGTLSVMPTSGTSTAKPDATARTPANGSLFRAPIRIDARPFPPGTLRLLDEIVPGRVHDEWIARTGFSIHALLASDGRRVELVVAVAPRRIQGLLADVAEASPRPAPRPAGLRVTLTVDGERPRHLDLAGGPNDLSGAEPLSLADGRRPASLRLALAGTSTTVLREMWLVLPPTAPDGEAVPCEVVHHETVGIRGSLTGATDETPYRYIVRVIIRSGTSVLAVRLIRTERLWTNLFGPPPLRETCP